MGRTPEPDRSRELDLRTLEVELFGAASTRAGSTIPTPADGPVEAHVEAQVEAAGYLIEFLAFPEDLLTRSDPWEPPSEPPSEAPSEVPVESMPPVPDVRAALPGVGRGLDPELEAAYFDVPPVPAASRGPMAPDDPYRPRLPTSDDHPRGPWRRRRSFALTWPTAGR
jgi:hypothetical protein